MKYNPRQEYFDRQTPAARSRRQRINRHQFGSSIGGDASNYKVTNDPEARRVKVTLQVLVCSNGMFTERRKG